VNVSPAAVSPFKEKEIVFVLAKIPDKLPRFRVFQQRPGRQENNDIFSILAVLAPVFTIPPVFGPVAMFIPQMRQSA
jgi:hypothetical protein